jgi:hypothetical protein
VHRVTCTVRRCRTLSLPPRSTPVPFAMSRQSRNMQGQIWDPFYRATRWDRPSHLLPAKRARDSRRTGFLHKSLLSLLPSSSTSRPRLHKLFLPHKSFLPTSRMPFPDCLSSATSDCSDRVPSLSWLVLRYLRCGSQRYVSEAPYPRCQ